MKTNAYLTLDFLGFRLDTDYIIHHESATSVRLEWLSGQARPTEAELQAVEPAALAALQAKEAQKVESDTARDDAKRALAALDTIITGIDAATLAQAKTAIKQLAQIQRHIILATVGR